VRLLACRRPETQLGMAVKSHGTARETLACRIKFESRKFAASFVQAGEPFKSHEITGHRAR
jgi:hypothetical protein